MKRNRFRILTLILVSLAEVPMTSSVEVGFQEIWTPMRDGVRLNARAFFPEGKGPWPIILVRTPYNLPEDLAWDAERLMDNGYALFYQNTRGRFLSEGEQAAFSVDGWGQEQDGYDTVEWIARQPWCNGQVATWGCSAPGITQYMMVGTAPPHLVCQHAGLATCNLFDYSVFQGGAYRQALCDGWLTNEGFDLEYFQRKFRENRGYGPYWQSTNLEEVADKINAPILHWGGWYDCFAQGTLDAFTLAHNRGGAGARGRQRLVMGPWPHGIAREHGAAIFPEVSLLPPHIDPLEWFDYWVKGKKSAAESAAAVQYFTMGDFKDPEAPGNEWREADNWPIPATSTPLFLASGGRLTADPAIESGSRSFDFDPESPVPTIGGANYLIDKGAFEQSPIEDRPDVLIFNTTPIARPLEITGRLTVRLYVTSDCVDTDFTAKLTDVYPDGQSIIIQDGIVRMQCRDPRGEPSLIEPGKVYSIDVDLWSTSLVLNTGHGLRLAVSSSNTPRFDVNKNNGSLFGEGKPVIARNTVLFGGESPSQVILPVVGDGPEFRM